MIGKIEKCKIKRVDYYNNSNNNINVVNVVLIVKGEMAELVESARLEIECTAKIGTVGSNPTLSAIKLLMSA